MLKFDLDLSNNVINILDDDKKVGNAKYIVENGILYLQMFEIPLNDTEDILDEYFKVTQAMSDYTKAVFEANNIEVNRVLWGTSDTIKDLDLYMSDVEEELLENQNLKQVNRR